MSIRENTNSQLGDEMDVEKDSLTLQCVAKSYEGKDRPPTQGVLSESNLDEDASPRTSPEHSRDPVHMDLF